jgi:chitodextrinase
MTIQISNGKPLVTGAKVSTTKPTASNGTASATVAFKAPGSSASTVIVAAGKGNTSQIDIDMLSSSSGVALATFESLKPATKFTYQITARNANGQSKTVTGKFTTPAAPKKVSGGGGSGQSSGSGYGTWVVGMRLDKALRALGWSRLQAAEYSGCRNKALAGIWNLDNWIVVGQTSSMLYACKP